MMSNTAPVAVLDSGIGGIGVLRELKRVLPNERFLYFGDSANAPYGEKTVEELRTRVLCIAERLFCRAKALVLACNTATAVAAEELRRRFPEPVIGMEPALRPALACATHPRILVLATKTTLRERKFAALCAKAEERAEVIALPAPGLVRFAEAGITGGEAVTAYLQDLLAPLHGIRPDAVVLGCTHFPLFRTSLAALLGEDTRFFDGAAGTARETARRLAATALCTPGHTRVAPPHREYPHPLPQGAVLLSASDPAALPLMRQIYTAYPE